MLNIWWTGSNLNSMMNPFFLRNLVLITVLSYLLICLSPISSSCYDLSTSTFILGTPFPTNFREVVKTIFKRLFRVYAHIYHSHFQKIVSLKEEAHLNTCFKHFILFTCVSSLSIWVLLHWIDLFEYSFHFC